MLYLWSCNQSVAWKCRHWNMLRPKIYWTKSQRNLAKFQNFLHWCYSVTSQYLGTSFQHFVCVHIWLHVFLPVSSTFFRFLPEETGRNTFFPVSSILLGRNLFLPEVSEPCIDQCNSLLYGLPDSHIAKLQRIQNSAPRLVTRTCFHDRITPVLQKSHWLPVRYRIMYKILILTYKCIQGLVPLYLQELIQEYKPTRNFRSSSKLNLISATVSSLTYGHRSFYKASAELWNSLPMHVKSCRTVSLFKSSLKTHLFKVAFDD